MATDAYDVLSTTEAKQILSIGLTDTTRDATVQRLVTAVSRRLDTAVGPVVQRTVTSEQADAHGSRLELRYGPVSTVASVTEYQGSDAVPLTEETLGTSPSDAWVGERYAPDRSLLSGILIRRSGGSTICWAPGYGNIEVTYTAGRAESTGAVDAKYKEAAALMLRNLWRSYEMSVGQVDQYDVPVQSYPTFAVPRAVRDLLSEEIQDPVGFG